MIGALAFHRSARKDEGMRHLYLNGAWQPSASGESIDVVNPATEELIDRVPAGSPADVEAAVAAARAALPRWSATAPAERGKVLAAAAALIRERSDQIARIISTDMGAPYRMALKVQTLMPAEVLDSYARLAEAYEFDTRRIGNSWILREPVAWSAPSRRGTTRSTRSCARSGRRSPPAARSC